MTEMLKSSLFVRSIASLRRDAVIVPFPQDESAASARLRPFDRLTGGALSLAIERGAFSGKRGDLHESLCEGSGPGRVVLVGCGPKSEIEPETMRHAIGAAVKGLAGRGVRSAAVSLDAIRIRPSNAEALAQAAIEGGRLADYAFDAYRSESSPRLKRLDLTVSRDTHERSLRAGVSWGVIAADGQCTARDLGNLPGNLGQPKVLADRARKLGKRIGLRVTAMGPRELERRGMHALLSVSLGSPVEPRLIVMEHDPGGDEDLPCVAVVGKGLTFDSGGISIKPSADLDKMRYDKCGGAAVIGLMQAVAQARLPLRVIGIVPSSENMPGGNANKPGDIVTASNGKSIQILNTDAEGRLILADALVHAQSFDPDVVVDLATLTGACMVALGPHCAGLMTRDDALARDLVRAGTETHERLWRLPLWDEYVDEMKGDVSDLKNLGSRYGGALSAAGFLHAFAGDRRWAHLDVAGVSWDDGTRSYNQGKGATGFGVRVMLQFLRNLLK